jgi:hypothetical protein
MHIVADAAAAADDSVVFASALVELRVPGRHIDIAAVQFVAVGLQSACDRSRRKQHARQYAHKHETQHGAVHSREAAAAAETEGTEYI